MRQEHALGHPRIVCGQTTDAREVLLAQPLPVKPPAVFAALGDVQRAFLLSRIIAVVIHAEKIAVRVKSQLLRVTFATGKTFHIGAIQFAAKNTAAVRPMNFHALRGGQRMPLVSQRPVHTPVRPHRQSAEIMPALPDVQ